MNRCGSTTGGNGNMVGPCTCGLFHSQGSCFSMLFAMPNHGYSPFGESDHVYSFASSTASVDCTLSLGTPSTRLSSGDGGGGSEKRGGQHNRRPSSCMTNFCWDILQSKQSSSPHKTGRGNSNSSSNNSGGDPLLARRCANCDTTSTPLWRNGPRGPKSLCNACGIRFKKEERRATAASGTTNGAAAAASGGGLIMEPQNVLNNSWAHHSVQSQKMPCYSPAIGNEFRFTDNDDQRDAMDAGIPFLSWRLNVTDRPSLVHDFTR